MDQKPNRQKPNLYIAAVILAVNLAVLGPWLFTDFSDQPWNNGYIYMATARMFRDLKWTWNPLHYAGAPFHYLYPPVFPFLVSAVPVASIGRAFHLVTGLGYAMIPVTVYVLGLQLYRSHFLAAFAATAYSLFPSPAYFLEAWRTLSRPYEYAPWGFAALIGYDEAAHAFGLLFTLLAIAAAWRNRWLLASVVAAVVFLTNWPALIGLGLGFGALMVARMRDRGLIKAFACVGGTAGAAYGLSAFWMTPGYFVSSTLLNRVVLRHTLTAAPFSTATWLILMTAALLIGLGFWRRVSPALAFPLVWAMLSGIVVVTYTLAGNYLLPSPHRYMLEFNASLVLLVAGLICAAPRRSRIPAVVILMVAGCSAGSRFMTHAWVLQPHSLDPHTTVAYQIADWLKDNAGRSRVYASGELDSTLNLWSNLPQVGGSGQDISNMLIFAAERQVAFGCGASSEKIAELWLRALNVRYFVVHEARSREYFHWYTQPEKYASMPVAWDRGAGDVVYAVPGPEPHEAVVVDLNELKRLPKLGSTADERFLNAYVSWAAGKRAATIRWSAADSASIDATPGSDEAILIKLNNDPGWRVSLGSAIQSDPLGFLLVRTQPGPQHLTLRFGAARDVWLGRAITALTIVLLLLVRFPRFWIGALAVLPAGAAWAILASGVPGAADIAEDAFTRLHPPLINPGGIVDAVTNQPGPFERGRLLSVYGLDFGSRKDSVRVWLGNREAEVTGRGTNLIAFRLPPDATPATEVSVEVNGCRGNEFAIETRARE